MTGTASMRHLTDDQIDDALIGDLAAEAAGHLAVCAACQQELAEARMPLESFKAVTLAWSERRSATMPVTLSERILHNSACTRRLAWGSAVAALMVMLVAAPFEMQHRANVPQQAGTTETAQVQMAQALGATGVVSGQGQQSEIAPAQIDSDNQMLNEIDRELDSSSASSEAMELQVVSGAESSHATRRTVQD